MSATRRLLGLEPGDGAPTLHLGALVGLASLAEVVTEGAVTSAFLARIGASALPLALALRAAVEVTAAVGYDRVIRRWSPVRASGGVALAGAVILTLGALISRWEVGVYLAFIAASSLARLRVIHFGVLALGELPSGRAARSLPVVYACSRFGSVLAGPILGLLGPSAGLAGLLLAAAATQLGATGLLARRGWWTASRAHADAAPASRAFDAEPSPASTRSTEPPAEDVGRAMLTAIVVGAIALALGRLALTTQSGAILEAHYDEATLTRVLGIYFTAVNAIMLVLQVTVVGRMLSRGGLPLLNLGWSLLYLAAQSVLALGPAAVVVALGARAVESEMRNTLRTPVANLLYEVIAPERQARARTIVIGVAIPLASLAGGAALAALGGHKLALAGLGLAAAIGLVLASWAQNRAWRRAQAEGR